MPGPADTTTIFDEEIAQLEKRRAEIEAERAKLLKGQITVKGPDGTTLMDIDLGALSVAASDHKTVERNLRQTLVENPLMPVLDNSFKKTRELREEMGGRGELQPGRRIKSPFAILIKANQQLDRTVQGKNQGLGRLVSSPWWLLVGVILILVWCGGPLLYALSGGVVGGKPLGTAVPAPVSVPTVTPGKTTTAAPTTAPRAIGAILTDFNPAGEAQINDDESQPQEETPTPTTLAPARVGSPPSSAGGFNGPHGSFLAPSRLTVAAVALDTPLERALTQNNTASGAAIVTWPRPGEVVQVGAYPGEIGNMLIMGNQKELGALRRVQQNDEVTVFDRKGNAFIYRFVAFSADGQVEREVDPTSLDDEWIFAPTQEAILTILVTYPQPLPAVVPNQTGNNQVTPRDDYLVQKKLAYRAVLAMYAPAKVTPAGTPVAVPQSVWQTVAAPTSTVSPTPAPATTTAPAVSPALPATVAPALGGDITPSPGSTIPSGLPNTGGGGLAPKSLDQFSPKQE
ncbi:MAG: hypothetical protein J0I20_29155 [Chloroflexi bacterium]|jgi:hypothetical protein|nr:hypothetical protein [Chloroflexota bacterium]OJV91701.1 MAG: hypothetical protein BGO39_32990 [Chloroflexi bacterium 54-19]